MHGIGATPLYTLGVSYLDDNLLPSTTSLFVGELKAETAVVHRYTNTAFQCCEVWWIIVQPVNRIKNHAF